MHSTNQTQQQQQNYHQMPNNAKPYAAAGAYEHHAKEGAESQRELEARVLLKSTGRLEELRDKWDELDKESLHGVLSYNRKAWLIFYDSAMQQQEEAAASDEEQNEVAANIRRNIIALARYIFGHEIDVLADPSPDKLDILISINRNIAAGLMSTNAADDGAKA